MSDEYYIKNIEQQINLIKKVINIFNLTKNDLIYQKINEINDIYNIEISNYEYASFNLKTRNIQYYIDETVELINKRTNEETHKNNIFKIKKIMSDIKQKKDLILTIHKVEDIPCEFCNNKKLSFDDDLFRFICKICKHVNKDIIPNTIEEEVKKDDNDGNYSKWKDKIYGRNICKLEPEKIIRIQQYIIINNYTKRELNHSIIRNIFKITKCSSKDYEYCNSFLSNYYNISSYIPSNKEQANMDIMYHRVKSINAKIKDDYINDRYCPYFIYKIVENLFADEPTKKKEISDFIYIQEYHTVLDRDNEWKKICKLYNKEYSDLQLKYKKTYTTAYSI